MILRDLASQLTFYSPGSDETDYNRTGRGLVLGLDGRDKEPYNWLVFGYKTRSASPISALLASRSTQMACMIFVCLSFPELAWFVVLV